MATDIDAMLDRSYRYTHDVLWEQWERWALLFVCILINTLTLGFVPLFSGYRYRIYKGETEPAMVDRWAGLFVDGWKLNIIWIVYFLVPLIIAVIIIGGMLLAAAGSILMNPAGIGDPEVFIPSILVAAGLFLVILIPLFIVLFIVLALLHTNAKVRAARSDTLMDAFGLRAILEHIGKIGWGNYVVLILLIWIIAIILGIVIGAFTGIPAVGWLIGLLIAPAPEIFKARYVTLVYDRGLDEEIPVKAGEDAVTHGEESIHS